MEKAGNPRPLTTAQAEQLLVLVRGRHGLEFTLLGPMRGGEGPGAYELRSPAGRAVLKFLSGSYDIDLQNVVTAIEELRNRGYPAPAYLCWGTEDRGTYVIQEQLPGTPIGDSFGEQQLDDALRLNALQADAGVDLPRKWPEPVVTTVLEGGDGYCLLETMREHSEEANDLLGVLQEIVRADGPLIDRNTDFVHFDFTQSNILAEHGRITGVIDWEAVSLGDRGFDLLTLMYYAYNDVPVRRRLFDAALDVSGPAAVRTYLSHIMLRQTEWSIRLHSEEVARMFVDRTKAILDDLTGLA